MMIPNGGVELRRLPSSTVGTVIHSIEVWLNFFGVFTPPISGPTGAILGTTSDLVPSVRSLVLTDMFAV